MIDNLKWVFDLYLSHASSNTIPISPDSTIDKFVGDWNQSPIFFEDILSIKGVDPSNYQYITTMVLLASSLREYGISACAYNYIGNGTVIPDHNDSDILSNIVLRRLFIPMCDTDFTFSGIVYSDYSDSVGEHKTIHSSELTDAIIFNPYANHSLIQNDENGHYLIADIFIDDPSPKDKLNYLMFALRHYF